MKLAATPHERTIDVDISSDAFWAQPFDERDETFARLRREAPVSWHPPTEFPFPHEEAGFWAVVRHEDINAVSRQTQRFGSRFGVSLDPMPLDLMRSLSFFLMMDAPEHARYRELVTRGVHPPPGAPDRRADPQRRQRDRRRPRRRRRRRLRRALRVAPARCARSPT